MCGKDHAVQHVYVPCKSSKNRYRTPPHRLTARSSSNGNLLSQRLHDIFRIYRYEDSAVPGDHVSDRYRALAAHPKSDPLALVFGGPSNPLRSAPAERNTKATLTSYFGVIVEPSTGRQAGDRWVAELRQ